MVLGLIRADSGETEFEKSNERGGSGKAREEEVRTVWRREKKEEGYDLPQFLFLLGW